MRLKRTRRSFKPTLGGVGTFSKSENCIKITACAPGIATKP